MRTHSKFRSCISRVPAASACLFVMLTCVVACEKEPVPAPQSNQPAPQQTAPQQPVAQHNKIPPLQEPTPVSPAATSGKDIAANIDGTYTVANITMALPKGWSVQSPKNPMRLMELHTGGEVNCIAALSSAGGTVQANLDRWKGQMLDESARPVTPQVDVLTINGLEVTVMSASGVYRGMGTTPPEKDTTLLGAIVKQADDKHFFIKMTGPTKAMAANRPAFDLLIQSLRQAK